MSLQGLHFLSTGSPDLKDLLFFKIVVLIELLIKHFLHQPLWNFRLQPDLSGSGLSSQLWPQGLEKMFCSTHRNVFLIKTQHFLRVSWKKLPVQHFHVFCPVRLTPILHFLHFVMSPCRPKCLCSNLWSDYMVQKRKMSEQQQHEGPT